MRPLPSTLAVGFDVVLPIDADVYRITEDARGKAWAFEFEDATRRHIADAVRDVFGRPSDVAELVVEPGYVRAKIEPSMPRAETAHAGDVLSTLRDAADVYNDRHAESDDEALAFEYEGYLASYRPDDAPDRERYLSGHADAESAPEGDGGPLWSYARPQAGEAALDADRAFAYRYVLPFDAEMYGYAAETGGPRHDFTWEPTEVREHLEDVVEDLVPFPGDPREGIPLVAIHPTHAVVEHWAATYGNPATFAAKVRRALLKFNGPGRPIDEARSPQGGEYRHPPLSFRKHAFVEAIDHGRTADEWIRERGLDAVTGEPIDPEPEEPEDVDEDGQGWRALTPFGGG